MGGQVALRVTLLVPNGQVGVNDGLMIGIELVQDRKSKTAFDPALLLGRQVCELATELGVWIRPLGDVVILMPPLSIQESELNTLADVVVRSIRSVVNGISHSPEMCSIVEDMWLYQ